MPISLPVVVERRSGMILAVFDPRHGDVECLISDAYKQTAPTSDFDIKSVGTGMVCTALLKAFERGYDQWLRMRDEGDTDDDFVIKVKMGPLVWTMGTYDAIMFEREDNSRHLN